MDKNKKVDKRSKAYRDSLKKLRSMHQVVPSRGNKVSGINTPLYTIEDFGKIQAEEMRSYVSEDAPITEQIKEIRAGLKDIWGVISELRGSMTNLQTKVG